MHSEPQSLDIRLYMYIQLIVTIKNCKGEGEWGKEKERGRLIFCYIDLAEGGSIVNFKWDSGGSWKGRKWDQDLPSDSQVIVIG